MSVVNSSVNTEKSKIDLASVQVGGLERENTSLCENDNYAKEARDYFSIGPRDVGDSMPDALAEFPLKTFFDSLPSPPTPPTRTYPGCAQIRRVAEVYVHYNLWVAAKENVVDKQRDCVKVTKAKRGGNADEIKKADAAVKLAEKASAEAAVRLQAARQQTNGTTKVLQHGGARRGELDTTLEPLVAEVTVVVKSAPNYKMKLPEKVANFALLILFILWKYVLFGWLFTPDLEYSSRDQRSMTDLTTALSEARQQRRILAAKIAQSKGRGTGSWFRFTKFGRVRRPLRALLPLLYADSICQYLNLRALSSHSQRSWVSASTTALLASPRPLGTSFSRRALRCKL